MPNSNHWGKERPGLKWARTSSLLDKSLQEAYDLTNNGELQDCLGTCFTQRETSIIVLEQPRMVERILEMVGLLANERVKMHHTPPCEYNLLDIDPEGAPRTQPRNYCLVAGSLSYLQAMI